MIRIVHVIARMNVGGPAGLVVALANGLDPTAYDVHVLTGDVQAGEADHLSLREPDLPVTRVPGLGRSVRPGDDARALAFLVRALRRLKPDVVHTHTAKAGVVGRVAADAARVPRRVHTFHGHLLHGYFPPRTTRAVVGAERLLARRTDRLVAVGATVRDDLLAAGIGRRERYVVIPPGVAVPPAPDRPTARRRLGLDPGAPVVAVVGRLTAIKRPDRMLAVARALPAVTMLVAGEGPAYDGMRAGAPPNVRFLGWVGDVGGVWAAADLALLTSDNEGMPVSLIEAALLGVPAVATPVGSVPEVVLDGRTGVLAAPDDLVAAVAGLLDDPDRRAGLGAAARTEAARFAPQRMVAAHAELYEQVVHSDAALLRGRPQTG